MFSNCLQKAFTTNEQSIFMRTRRAYLASLAAAGLAGCLGNPSNSETDSPTATATEEPGTSTRPELTIRAATVQYSFREIESVDWNAIRTTDGQFVFVTIEASEVDPIPNRNAFSLVADDDLHDPIPFEQTFLPELRDVPGELYKSEQNGGEPRGWLGFEVPAQLDTEPSFRLENDADSWEWELDTEKATAPPPAWEWTASVPETVALGETFDITVSAENVGEGPGTFRGAVNFSYPYMARGFDIGPLGPGGEGEAAVPTSADHNPPETRDYQVRTPAGRSEVSVTVERKSTTTESAN